ncbi:MAG TPA: IPT/TIG domain-containing protein, partial [Niastella sp.]
MRQLSVDATDGMNEVQEFSFYAPSEGYVAFSKYIGFTTDSGRTFTRKYITFSNVNYNTYPVNLTFGFGIKGVKAFNQDTIIVYGDYGIVPSILYSTDRGNSFTLVYHDRYDVFAFKSGITSMIFPQDHTIGYAVEADRILKTTDKGRNWFVVRLDVDRYYDHVVAIDNNNVFAFSTDYSSNKLFKTNNGGSTWIEVTVPPGQIVYTHFLTAVKGWLIMKNDDQLGVVYYTSNGGITWEQKNDPKVTPFYSSKFRFVNDSTGYGIAGLFSVYKTTDSGKVWQQLPRDNNYTYLNYNHNDIQVLNPNQLWAGGGHGFIEINTNSSDNPLPSAFFRTDTSGVAATGIVNLLNYSKPIYQYKWFKNDTLISTAYHTSFTHNIYQFRDTIKLVVSDGTHSDTLVKYIDYPRVWITGFTPTSAIQGGVVTINGFGFSGAFNVRFGGVSASSFTVISNTQIQAIVGGGSSGNVEVITAQDGSGLKGGFIYLGVPNVNLPSAISDSILCKSEPVIVTIQNSEPGVLYQLMSWGFGATVGGSATGNGGTISFVTSPISQSGQYRVRANRIGDPVGYGFKSYFNIKVEHTRARFVADQVNITPGEPVTYAALAGEARDFLWTFYQDASTATAAGAKVAGISYASSGQKTLQLISVSENGCRDTTSGNAAFVYPGSANDASCFINPMDSTGAAGMTIGQVMNSNDDGIYVIGATTNATKLRSTIGVAKEFASGNHSFFAKYNTSGVLKWVHYFKPGTGEFKAGQTDAQGNIYLTGYAVSTQWLYFSNGDSMQFYAAPVDTTYMGSRTNGFVLKLDRNGKYIWHTILYDHITLWQGYAANAKGERIAIKDDHIIVIGGFYSKLSYARNGVIQPLYDIPSGVREHENHVVLKIRPDGTMIWNALLRFQATNHHSLADVSVDKAGNSYLVGQYEDYLGIYDVNGVERVTLRGPTAYHQAFMVKYDAVGTIQWHNNFKSSYQYGDAGLTKVVADDDGNTYVAGSMFNWGMPVTINITHSDGTIAKDSLAAFALYKFDTNGKRRWGVGSRYPYYGGAGALYAKGNEVYAAGQLYNNGVPLSTFELTSSDGNTKTLVINQGECYVAKYDTAGIFKRVYTSGWN